VEWRGGLLLGKESNVNYKQQIVGGVGWDFFWIYIFSCAIGGVPKPFKFCECEERKIKNKHEIFI
jgi:hypothetical protein